MSGTLQIEADRFTSEFAAVREVRALLRETNYILEIIAHPKVRASLEAEFAGEDRVIVLCP